MPKGVILKTDGKKARHKEVDFTTKPQSRKRQRESKYNTVPILNVFAGSVPIVCNAKSHERTANKS